MDTAKENPQNEQHDNEPHDEAVSLFSQIADEDSKDSADEQLDDEQLDQGDKSTDGDDGQEQEPGNDQQDDDPWKDAPEHLRNKYQETHQAYEKLQADHRANAGRVAALNRKLQELEGAKSDAATKAGQPKEEQPSAEELAGLSDDELEQEWPEIAAAMKKREQRLMQQFEERLTPLQKQQQEWLEQQKQQQEQQQMQAEATRLKDAHPDYEQVINDPAFHNWKNSLPAKLQDAVDSAATADEAIYFLNQFKSATGRTGKPAASQQPRKNALKDHAVIPRKGAGRAAADPNSADPVALFNQIAT